MKHWKRLLCLKAVMAQIEVLTICVPNPLLSCSPAIMLRSQLSLITNILVFKRLYPYPTVLTCPRSCACAACYVLARSPCARQLHFRRRPLRPLQPLSRASSRVRLPNRPISPGRNAGGTGQGINTAIEEHAEMDTAMLPPPRQRGASGEHGKKHSLMPENTRYVNHITLPSSGDKHVKHAAIKNSSSEYICVHFGVFFIFFFHI